MSPITTTRTQCDAARVRRLREAAGSVAFFLGLALICASLIEFHRWPFLVLRLVRADFVTDPQRWAVGPFLEPWIRRDFAPFNDSPLRQFLELGLVAAAAVGLFGIILSAVGRRPAGSRLLAGAALSGAALLVIGSCTPVPLVCEKLPVLINGFSALVGIVVVGWLQRESPTPFRAVALTGLGISAAMVTVTIVYAVGMVDDQRWDLWRDNGWVQPDRPHWALIALLACGVVLSLASPPYRRIVPALLVLGSGLALTIPAIAIAHDGRIEPDGEHLIETSPNVSPVPTTHCRQGELAPLVMVTPTTIVLAGHALDTTAEGARVEEQIFSELARQLRRDQELYEMAGEQPETAPTLQLYADRSMTMPTFGALARASARAGYRDLDIISLPDRPVPVWTMPLVHRHVCSVRVELGEEGPPLSDFADWPALVSAADSARGDLRVKVR